jgi:hypothetical protein
MTWRPKERETVRIVCAPQHEGGVCRNAGGMLPGEATIALMAGNHAFVQGGTRSFTLRKNGQWILHRTSMRDGPRLERKA